MSSIEPGGKLCKSSWHIVIEFWDLLKHQRSGLKNSKNINVLSPWIALILKGNNDLSFSSGLDLTIMYELEFSFS